MRLFPRRTLTEKIQRSVQYTASLAEKLVYITRSSHVEPTSKCLGLNKVGRCVSDAAVFHEDNGMLGYRDTRILVYCDTGILGYWNTGTQVRAYFSVQDLRNVRFCIFKHTILKLKASPVPATRAYFPNILSDKCISGVGLPYIEKYSWLLTASLFHI